MDKILQAMIGLTFLSMVGCTYYPPLPDWGDGELVMQAAFANNRTTQVIPEETRQIEVRVKGEGIPDGAVLFATLTPQNTQVKFSAVPAGNKEVTVKAFDASGTLLAAGSSRVAIVAGATVASRIRLSLLNDSGQFELVLE